MPGPIGKRSDQKHGHRTKTELDVDRAPSGSAIEWYDADPQWHEIATRWYESLKVSGQSVFYQQSDVATAYLTAEAISRLCKSGRFSGQLYASIMSNMGELVVTEGARRRAKIELDAHLGDEGTTEVDDAIADLLNQFE